MSSRDGAVVLDIDPEFVEGGRIERQHINRSALTRIDIRVTHIAVEVVHVQTSRSECESCRGAGIFDCLVQAEGNEHAAAARLTDSEHSFAIAYIYEAVGCVRQLDQGIGSRS